MKVCTKHRDAEIHYGTRYAECPLCKQTAAVADAAHDLSCAFDEIREYKQGMRRATRDAIERVSRLLDDTFDTAAGDLR